MILFSGCDHLYPGGVVVVLRAHVLLLAWAQVPLCPRRGHARQAEAQRGHDCGHALRLWVEVFKFDSSLCLCSDWSGYLGQDEHKCVHFWETKGGTDLVAAWGGSKSLLWWGAINILPFDFVFNGCCSGPTTEPVPQRGISPATGIWPSCQDGNHTTMLCD